MGVNKRFRAITIKKDVLDYIEQNKLGRRRPEPKSKETRLMNYKKVHSIFNINF